MSDSPLVAETACRALMARYCVCVDARRHGELGALFADDGELHIAGRLLHGSAAITAFFDERPPSLSLHLPGAEWVDVDQAGGTAGGGCSVAVWRAAVDPASAQLPHALPAGPVLARYEDRFVHTPQGWRFASRHALPVFAPPP